MKRTWTILLLICFLFPLNLFADECIEGDCVNGKGNLWESDGKLEFGIGKVKYFAERKKQKVGDRV